VAILISGETGTGKEILAQAIHNASARAHEPFVGVNVSAIPRELLESELFGYEAGAFTGASIQGHAGKFELAENGTLLLDEIGEMPLEMQAKLLRVLQEKVVQRLGGSRAKAFNARVIASTNRDLEVEVAAGRFRLDLLHRLRVVQVQLPPLRERGGDIRLLIDQQLLLHGKNLDRAIHLAPHVMAAFEGYSWPGNVRELVNMLEGEVSLMPTGNNVIDVVPDVIERSTRRMSTPSASGESLTLESAERKACARALNKANWNVALAARILGVVKATLYSKMKRYGLEQSKVDAARPNGLPAARR
jgi:transcriptional regulator with PAS, ATPase and Fis domain